MKKTCILFMLSLCTLSYAGIEGQYQVKGHDPYKNLDYSGVCTIKKEKNDVYQAHWSFDDGEQFLGTGLVSRDAASFIFSNIEGKSENQEKIMGLQMYDIDGPTLKGRWVISGGSLIGIEQMQLKK